MLDPQTTALLVQMGFDAGTIESLMSSLIVLTVVAVVAAVPTGIIAKRKARSTTLWLVLALTIPVIPLLVIWFLPNVNSGEPPAER